MNNERNQFKIAFCFSVIFNTIIFLFWFETGIYDCVCECQTPTFIFPQTDLIDDCYGNSLCYTSGGCRGRYRYWMSIRTEERYNLRCCNPNLKRSQKMRTFKRLSTLSNQNHTTLCSKTTTSILVTHRFEYRKPLTCSARRTASREMIPTDISSNLQHIRRSLVDKIRLFMKRKKFPIQ